MFYKSLLYFVETCQSESIAQAAEKLYLSRQALSLTLKRFEEDVGVPLFVRGSRGIALTSAGEAFYKRCVPILADLDAAVKEAQKDTPAPESIRVAFTLIALKILTTEAVMGFERDYPSVRLNFTTMLGSEAYRQLVEGKLDFICSLRPVKNGEFCTRLVRRGFPCLLTGLSSPLSQKKVITIDDLQGITLLQSDLSELFESQSKLVADISYRFFTNDPALISDAVANGLGSYIVPINTLSVFNTERLAVIPLEDGLVDLNLYLSYRTENALSPVALAFAEYICLLGNH